MALLSTSNNQAKRQLRQTLRRKRRSLTPLQQAIAAKKIATKISHSNAFKKAKYIAFYLPSDGEISLQPLLEIAHKKNKQCFLPVIGPHRHMFFRRYKKHDGLRKNIYGILEPKASAPRIATDKLQLVFMPLVGFDDNGNRLGMGGGYYDRAFAFRQSKIKNTPRLIGTAHHCQYSAHLPTENWDIPLDMIVSDKKIYRL